MASSADVLPELTSKEMGGSLGRAFLTYAHVILPPFAMYIAHGPFYLRLWSTVQYMSENGPIPILGEDKKPKLDFQQKTLIGTIYFISLLAIWVYKAAYPDVTIVWLICAGLSYAIAWPSVAACALLTLGNRKFVVSRNVNNLRWVDDVPSEPGIMGTLDITLFGTSAVITFVGFMFHNQIGLAVAYCAVLHMFTHLSSEKLRVQTMRGFLMFFTFISTILLFSGILIIALLHKENDKGSQPPEDATDDSSIDVLKLVAWWLAVQATVPLQDFISICYRFDCSNSRPSNFATDADVAIFTETVPPIVPGVFLPSRISRKFAKPYYITAISAWVATNIFLLFLSTFGNLPEIFHVDDYALAIVAAFIAVPMVLFAVLGVAVAKDEFSKVWMYQEDWSISASGHRNNGGSEEVGLLSSS